MTKLKPCPFCGGEGKLVVYNAAAFKKESAVICQECFVRGPSVSVSPEYASSEKATEAWNRRVSDEQNC